MFDKTGKVCFLQSDINCERIEAVVNKFSQWKRTWGTLGDWVEIWVDMDC